MFEFFQFLPIYEFLLTNFIICVKICESPAVNQATLAPVPRLFSFDIFLCVCVCLCVCECFIVVFRPTVSALVSSWQARSCSVCVIVLMLIVYLYVNSLGVDLGRASDGTKIRG